MKRHTHTIIRSSLVRAAQLTTILTAAAFVPVFAQTRVPTRIEPRPVNFEQLFRVTGRVIPEFQQRIGNGREVWFGSAREFRLDGWPSVAPGRSIFAPMDSSDGFISTNNPWNTSHSAFFPNGITTAGSANWIYGATTFIGNAPSNGFGHQFNASSGASHVYLGIGGGNVGIGTTSPATLLNVNLGPGDATFGTQAIRVGGTNNYASLELGIKGPYDGMISTYGNDLHLYAGNWRCNGCNASENHNLWFYTSQNGSSNWNTPKMVLDFGGNLGIGTTNPLSRLNVQADATYPTELTNAQLILSGSTDPLKRTVLGYDTTNNFGYLAAGRSGNGWTNIALQPSGGNVGIGTTSPSYKLDVNGTTQALTFRLPNGFELQQGASNYGQFNSWVHLNGHHGFYSSLNGAHIYPNDASYGAWRIQGTRSGYGGINYNGKSVLMMQDDLIGLYNEPYGRWTIYGIGSTGNTIISPNGGNVGIGMTDPGAYKLNVNGEINATGLRINGTPISSGSSQWTSGTSSISYSDGNVGIGTTAPNYKLDVAGSGISLVGSGDVGAAVNITNTGKTGAGTANYWNIYNMTGGYGNKLSFWAYAATNACAGGLCRNTFDIYDDGRVYVPYNLGVGTNEPGDYRLKVSGNTNVAGNLTITANGTGTGNIVVDGTINAKYQDVAEWVPSSEQLAAGTVVVLDSTKSNQVISSSVSYDTRVAGVISAQPGIALGEKGDSKVLVATTGRVKVKVDASKGPIRIGDLLVTSDVPGVAMRSEPVELAGRKMHMPGTLIGKALEPLEKGKGEILVLLSLQ